jgi:ribosome production factor 2
LAKKNDTSLFVLGSHSKKRPNNLVFGRLFNFAILDMVEFGVEEYIPMINSTKFTNLIGSKPLMIFNGEYFENNEEMKITQNFFIDFFQGERPKTLSLEGIDHCLIFTALSGNFEK